MNIVLEDLLYQDISQIKKKGLTKVKRAWAKKLGNIPKHSTVLAAYHSLVKKGKISKDSSFAHLLTTRKIRSSSGVVPFAVMMKPFYCPGKCTYCVLEPGMPKSYMSDEPAAARAKALSFDPFAQVETRIKQLRLTGHTVEKLQIIVIGGTFSAYPHQYKQQFLQDIFVACNNIHQDVQHSASQQPIQKVQEINQTARHRIIGMSIETRPDWVTDEEIRLLRNYGVTKVQLGVQAIDDQINSKTQRGHTVEAVKTATQKLRDAGFKINYHFMPNLPGSNPQKDITMCQQLFSTNDFKPDTIKIYPCIVIPNTVLWEQWKAGEYQSYSDETLARVLTECVLAVPTYCRIDRLVRDINRKWTASGTKKTNMRQIISKQMQHSGTQAQDIRAREVRNKRRLHSGVLLRMQPYTANNAKEIFISFEDDQYLFGMLRLRLPKRPNPMEHVFPVLQDAAIIREIQVFGKPASIDAATTKKHAQHQSLGKQLIAQAEAIASYFGYSKIVVISGVGVRDYYRSRGYNLQDTYMVKSL